MVIQGLIAILNESGELQMKKEMAAHSSVLAWRIPGTAEPGGLPSMGSHRVEHDWSNLAVAVAAVSCRRPEYDTIFIKL